MERCLEATRSSAWDIRHSRVRRSPGEECVRFPLIHIFRDVQDENVSEGCLSAMSLAQSPVTFSETGDHSHLLTPARSPEGDSSLDDP